MARRDRPDPPSRGPTPDPDAIMAYWTKMGLAEPDEGTRGLARIIRQFYSGLVMEGFDPQQALSLTAAFTTAMTNQALNRGRSDQE